MKSKLIKQVLLGLAISVSLLLSACSGASYGNDQEIDAAAAMDKANEIVWAKVEQLYDDYAVYYTSDEYDLVQAEYQGSFGGIGISMIEDEGDIVVYSIIKNTPAARSSIAVGDAILSVDGQSLAGKDSSSAAILIRGDVGESVSLTLRRKSDGSTYEEKLVRATITTETVSGTTFAAYPGLAYIHITSFNELTSEDFVKVYNELSAKAAIEYLILDLRSNGGGNFSACIEIGHYFVPKGQVVVSEKTSTETLEYDSKNGQLSDLPVVVLQNGYTASASEVLIGAIKDEGNATLIGSTTYGKGVTQSMVRLTSGSGHKYTRSIYYTPSGFSLNGIGLAPDIEVADPEETTIADYFSFDPATNAHLKAALDYLFPDGPPQQEQPAADGDEEAADDQAEEGAEENTEQE